MRILATTTFVNTRLFTDAKLKTFYTRYLICAIHILAEGVMESDVKKITERVKQESDFVNTLMYEVGKVIVGQKYLIERLLIGILSSGHVLLEGVPGLAKTMSVMTLARAMQAGFQRIQFTPDLLPADLVGTLIYNPKSGDFTIRKGPIFTNIVLADEINRAPAKVQSALLEAMQDRQVTIGDQTFQLEDPFLVLATQNPIEHEGTYPLPEAQVDRFMLKLIITYPDKKEEREILERMALTKKDFKVTPVISPADILRLRSIVDEIYIDDKIKDYIVDIVFASREPKAYNLKMEDFIEYGASPRATIYLALAAKAHAFIRGRGFVTPQDVKSIGMDVLRHRVIITYEAEAEEIRAEDIVQKIFDTVEVP
ncbi:ATPase RavA [Candidatus Brocadiaceae bacterium B188]|nr:ATPase RavA [Candidatus Brocadiaceae bacterium B188]